MHANSCYITAVCIKQPYWGWPSRNNFASRLLDMRKPHRLVGEKWTKRFVIMFSHLYPRTNIAIAIASTERRSHYARIRTSVGSVNGHLCCIHTARIAHPCCISGIRQSGTLLDLDRVSLIPAAALPPITDKLRVYLNFHVGGRVSWPNQYDLEIFVL